MFIFVLINLTYIIILLYVHYRNKNNYEQIVHRGEMVNNVNNYCL